VTAGGGRYAVAAVSDGHGAEPYFRSGTGAKRAVEVSMNAAAEFISRVDGSMLHSAEDVNKQLSQLEKCIISRWGDAVYEDFLEHPYSDDEIAKIPPDWGFDDSVYSVYGCTLLLVAVTEHFWFGLQIGDGRIVEFTNAGERREPVPWDENCFLNATTSICDISAADEFRHFYSEKLPEAVVLATDGVSESFNGKPGLYNMCNELLRDAHELGKSKAAKTLVKILPSISTMGGGDDVSVAMIYRKIKKA
jgi:hypothetical protein